MKIFLLALTLAIVNPVLTDDDAFLIEPTYALTPQQQTLIHGAGGCTPNFSTGGCL